MKMQFEFDRLNEVEEKIIGIYAITSKYDGKNYVGQTINKKGFCGRFEQHRDMLRKGIHDNIYLQRSYTKHGENQFIFRILEICDKDTDLNLKEKYWIDDLKSMFFQKGWNIDYIDLDGKRRGEYRIGSNFKEFELILPSGELFRGKNLSKFAKDNKLNSGNLSKLVNGIYKTYKGYKSTHPNAQIVKPDLYLISPIGENITVKAENKSQFMKDIGVDKNRGTFANMLAGKIRSCKGWKSQEHFHSFKCMRKSTRDLLIFGETFICSPQGVAYKFKDYKKFSNKYDINRYYLIDLIRGVSRVTKKAMNSYKGWTILKEYNGIFIQED